MTAIITEQRIISLENLIRTETVQIDNLSLSHNSNSTSSYQPPLNCISSPPVNAHWGSINEYSDSFLARSNDDPFDDDGFDYNASNFKRWSVVIGSFFGLLSAFGFINSAGVIQTYVITHHLADVDTTTISWIFSIFTCLSLICTIFSETYFGRNGARIPLIIGSIIHTACLFSIGNCTVVWQFVLDLGVGVGIASGVLISVYISVIAQYFSKKERSIPMATATNGSDVGGFMYPLILRKSYKSIGFMWSMRLCSLISLICLSIAFLLVKERRLVE